MLGSACLVYFQKCTKILYFRDFIKIGNFIYSVQIIKKIIFEKVIIIAGF